MDNIDARNYDRGMWLLERFSLTRLRRLVLACLLYTSVEEAPDDVELSPMLQQPGRGAHVANRRRVIGQPAGVLIDAQEQQRRLFRG